MKEWQISVLCGGLAFGAIGIPLACLGISDNDVKIAELKKQRAELDYRRFLPLSRINLVDVNGDSLMDLVLSVPGAKPELKWVFYEITDGIYSSPSDVKSLLEESKRREIKHDIERMERDYSTRIDTILRDYPKQRY